jgi:hypothetical protein
MSRVYDYTAVGANICVIYNYYTILSLLLMLYRIFMLQRKTLVNLNRLTLMLTISQATKVVLVIPVKTLL